MRIFFSVGEPSGDLHGANLITALRRAGAGCEFVGFGGPRMSAAGCRLEADLTELAVMWFARAVWYLPRFLVLLFRADRIFRDSPPAAVVLIDYPGFNWWIARRAKKRGIPVFYYGTPQLWAWASYRVAKMRKYVDHVLCKLPFEERWFRDRGCNATYVGHPYFDELSSRQVDAKFVSRIRAPGGKVVALLPGSRDQEVQSNAATMLRSAGLIAREIADVRFVVAAYKQAQADEVSRLAAQLDVPVEVFVGRTPELIEAADCCLACSGSVSLELLYHARPSVILYQVSRMGFALQRYFRHVRYITLVNLLTAGDPFTAIPAGVYDRHDPQDTHVLMPEYLTCVDKARELADHCVEWLEDPAVRNRRVIQLQQLRDRVGAGGASHRAAQYLIAHLPRATSGCQVVGRESAA